MTPEGFRRDLVASAWASPYHQAFAAAKRDVDSALVSRMQRYMEQPEAVESKIKTVPLHIAQPWKREAKRKWK